MQRLSKKNKSNYEKKQTKPRHGAKSFAAYRFQKVLIFYYIQLYVLNEHYIVFNFKNI